MELNDVLSDTPPEAVEPVAPVEPVEAKTVERAPDGKFAAKEPEPKVERLEPPKVEMTEKERALLATATEERRKRQALEQEIAQLRQTPKEPPKPFWDDPEGALNQHKQDIEQTKQQMANMFLQEKMKTSEYHARKVYPDFDQKVEEFGAALKDVPGLLQEWLSAPDPAEFAYKTAKNRIELREVGNIEQYRAKIEKEAYIKAEAEFKKKMEDLEKQRQSIPDSLSSAPGTPGQNKPVWDGPPSLGAILGS